MKKLPIGIQDFAELRKGGYLYVDKTRYVHELATSGKYFFLSRPRRFGKSLLVSTLRELFQGNQPLFQGLWIENHWDWQQTHPIIHIPFSSLGFKDLGLERALHEHLDDLIAAFDLPVREESLALKFRELIRRLHQSAGNRVVVLIDEYDKPIIDYLGE
ncbi:MAG: AAA family ATPase, partial [Bacteroidetes bacterium]